jgi:hypothetical protein
MYWLFEIECSTWNNLKIVRVVFYSRLLKVNAPTFLKPAFFKIFAHSDSVAPLVKTSSTKMMFASFLIDFILLLLEIVKAFHDS